MSNDDVRLAIETHGALSISRCALCYQQVELQGYGHDTRHTVFDCIMALRDRVEGLERRLGQ